MSVTVRIPTVLRELAGGRAEVQASGGNVAEVLSEVGEEHPDLLDRITEDDGELREFLNLYVNGRNIRMAEELETGVEDGDEISITPSIAGGLGEP